ncbi:MAG TPA: helix-turn-helix domain-containing protein [Candidatus Acidoferrum sp.]|nr:helix-turn-helix domain-containing protein [Candidatus Acidoferrum sp.]
MSAMHSPVRSLGAFLRRLREERELTQKQVARDLGISQSALSAWESGQTLPPRPQIERIAGVLGVGVDQLEAYFEKAESEESYAPRSLGRIHAQAAEHVKRYGAENLSIWILGATNLSVMESTFVQERWRANLGRGIDYNLVWFLDLVPEESFRAAIAIIAEIERRTAAEHKGQRGAAAPGVIHHYATSGFEAPSDMMMGLYRQLRDALGTDRDNAAKARVHPYVGATKAAPGSNEAAVAEAARKLLRCWQPETGIVFYRPKTITTPPVANIRLMPVSEHIVEGLSPEAEQSQYWFWLSPRGAARINNAVTAFERAILAMEQKG